MKLLLVLVACVASAYAGVGVVTPEIEAEAHRLWEKFCEDAARSDGGNTGGVAVFCKISRDIMEEKHSHEVRLTPGPTPAQQVVFVQPPSYHYTHDVVVSGQGNAAPKTVIFVKPAKNTNEINIKDLTQPGKAPAKPTLYFLKGEHGSEQQVSRTESQSVKK